MTTPVATWRTEDESPEAGNPRERRARPFAGIARENKHYEETLLRGISLHAEEWPGETHWGDDGETLAVPPWQS